MDLRGKILYYIIWVLGWCLGRMPRLVQYLHADLLYLLLYKLGRYRVKTVRLNLKNSFPEKSVKQLQRIEHLFYLHLMDLFVETIIMIGLSKKEMDRRMVFYGNELFDEYCSRGSVVTAMAHYGSWEYPIFYATKSDNLLIPVYHKLQSEWADRLFYNIRTRYGALPTAMQVIGRTMIKHKDEKLILALIADQTPPWKDTSPWITFLNQDTRFFQGIEVFSRKYNMPVFFCRCNRAKRGYYEAHFELIYDGIEELPQYGITQRYIDKLEEVIRERPELWMWSHKRWKHKKI